MAMTRIRQTSRRQIEEASRYAARLARLWRDDLRDLVPVRHRQILARILDLPAPLVVELDPDGLPRPIGLPEASQTFASTNTRVAGRLVTLRVDEASLLRRRLELPGVAVTRLDATLATNLERWTPFAPMEIYAAAHPLVEIGPRPGMKIVELRCVPRPRIDEEIQILCALDLEPDGIELGDARFALPRATRKRRALRRRNLAVACLAAALVVQALGGYALLSNHQSDEIAALEVKRDEVVTALRRRADTEREATARSEGARRIAARMDAGLGVSRGLSLLAEALPPDAVVREFEVGRDRADGHVVILAAAGLDVVEALGRTGFYHVGDLGVLPGSDADRKVFSVGFTVPPWVKVEGRAAR